MRSFLKILFKLIIIDDKKKISNQIFISLYCLIWSSFIYLGLFNETNQTLLDFKFDFFLFSTWQSKKYKGRVLLLSFCLFFLLLIDRSIYTTRIFLFFLYRAPLADVNVSILLSLIYMSMRGWECTMRDNVSICRIGWRTENLFLCFCYEKSPDSYCNQPQIIDKQKLIDSFLLHLQYISTVSTHESCDLS